MDPEGRRCGGPEAPSKGVTQTLAAAERKKAHCLKKALSKSQQDYDHALVVFEHATLPDRLGPITGWTDALWRALFIMFGSSSACAVEWGPDFHLLYNFDYAPISGHRHPQSLGRPMSHPDCWADIWDVVHIHFEKGWAGDLVFIESSRFNLWDAKEGLTLERYFDYSLNSIDDDDGSPLGLLNTVVERTEQVFSDRCYGVTMPAISKANGYNAFTSEYLDTLRYGLQSNPLDLPAVLLYDIQDSMANLILTVGTEGKNAADLIQQHQLGRDSDAVICQLLNQANQTKQPLETADEQILSVFELPEFRPERGILYPIVSEVSGELIAAIFIGLNAYRRFAGSYASFLELVINQIGSSLRNMKHMRAQLQHHKEIATLNAAKSVELEAALELRTRELLHAELRYRNLTDNSPAGIFAMNPNGAVIYVNKAAWSLAGAINPEVELIDSLLQEVDRWVHHTCIESYTAQFEKMFATMEPMEQTYRAAKDWPDGSARWLQITTVVEKDEHGAAVIYHGFCLDVSHTKQLELLTSKRISDALESRRQQEAFIDMTSHEMRNPLSAIAQTADLVTANLHEALLLTDTVTLQQAIVEAQGMLANIEFLTRHMRCIADDMIAISKINSNLLAVRPKTTVVSDFLHRISGMFAAELKAQDVQIGLHFDTTSIVVGQTRCQFDPTRVSQILINLITNAIKHISRRFATGATGIKRIDVSVGLTAQLPFALDLHGAPTVPSLASGSMTPQSPEIVETAVAQFLMFSVQDTGVGLSQMEANQILKRFTEQGPKTHSMYGGSGLSLFICRRLAELQGGQICSRPVPKGATGTSFAFFVRAPVPSCQEETVTGSIEISGDAHSAGHGRPDVYESPSPTQIPPSEPQSPQQVLSRASTAAPVSPRETMSSDSASFRPPIRALVVEDNILNQRLLRKQLERAGYDVDVANNGLECLNKIQGGNAFDIILLDREMPVCDGLACLIQMRQMERQRTLLDSTVQNSSDSRSAPALDTADPDPDKSPRTSQEPSVKLAVITISANARKEQIDEMMEAGSDDYVTKPFRFPDLDARIKQLLASYRAL